MNPQDLPKGPSRENPGDKKPANKAGVYRHPQANQEIIVMPDAQSTAQQDAVVRMGYQWVAPPPTRAELVAMQARQLAIDNQSSETVSVPTVMVGDGKDAKIAALQRQLEDAYAAPLSDEVPAETETPAKELTKVEGK